MKEQKLTDLSSCLFYCYIKFLVKFHYQLYGPNKNKITTIANITHINFGIGSSLFSNPPQKGQTYSTGVLACFLRMITLTLLLHEAQTCKTHPFIYKRFL
jgi:hypothetical protein